MFDVSSETSKCQSKKTHNSWYSFAFGRNAHRLRVTGRHWLARDEHDGAVPFFILPQIGKARGAL